MTAAASAGPLRRAEDRPRSHVGRFAWWTLAYTGLVILFGAVVRITGSGAGCGQHWPTCHGEVAHLPRSVATWIELTHRLTSGLGLLLVVALTVAAFRTSSRGSDVRRMAAATAVLMVVESLIGAALVLLRLVENDASHARAVVMSLHLVNTSLLTGAMALTAWTAGRPAVGRWSPAGRVEAWLTVALGVLLVVSTTGAVTALGDTLYPVDATRALADRMAADQGATATFLERGRAVHPVVAIFGAGVAVAAARQAREHAASTRVAGMARAVIGLTGLQVSAGVLNIALSAPPWMQVLHLGLALGLWLSLVLLYAAVKTEAAALRTAGSSPEAARGGLRGEPQRAT